MSKKVQSARFKVILQILSPISMTLLTFVGIEQELCESIENIYKCDTVEIEI